MKKIAFLINGTAKKRKALNRTLPQLFSEFEHQLFISESVGHLAELASQAISDGFTHIIVAGGDGSVNELINGVMKGMSSDSGELDFEKLNRLRLGIIPIGTGNDFVKSIGVENDLDKLYQMIQKDSHKAIDIGHVEFTSPEGNAAERYFMNITDTGMGGAVAERLIKSRVKWLSSTINYMLAIITTFLTYKKSPAKCYHDDFSWEGNIMSLNLANGKYYGSGLGIAPEAELDSGEFSLVILGDITLMDYFRNLSTVRKCKKIDHPEVHYFSVPELTIESLTKEIPIDMDGEFIGFTPMHVKKFHKVVNVICPA